MIIHIVLTILASVLGAIPPLVLGIWNMNRYLKQKDAEMKQWIEERKELLDRIQSPTFSEYKHQEAKIIKAKNGTDKADIIIEQL